MHLRIMPQRFKVPDTFYRCLYRLLVHDPALSELHSYSEPLIDQASEYLDLHLSHKLGMDLAGRLIPYDVEFRFFFFQLS